MMSRRFNTIRFKIGILYTLVLGIILLAYTSFLYLSLKRSLYRDLDEKLQLKLRVVTTMVISYMDILGYSQEAFVTSSRQAIDLTNNSIVRSTVQGSEAVWLGQLDTLAMRNDAISFFDDKGRYLLGSFGSPDPLAPLSAEDIELVITGRNVSRNVVTSKGLMRVANVALYYDHQLRYIVQIASPMAEVTSMLRARLYYRLIPLPFFIFVGFFIGGMFVRRILRPVVHITAAAQHISSRDLSARVKLKDIDEEMKYLVDAFNGMIGRLEKSFQYVSDFSSEVAHELKTPLSIIRGEAELALRKERNREEYVRALQVTLEETEKMLKTIDDLFLLARLDFQLDSMRFERCDLVALLQDVCEKSLILAQPKNISLRVVLPRDAVFVNGVFLHLRRLVFNLVDNAIKYTPPHGAITLSLSRERKKVVVCVADTGIGIPEKDIARMGEKFYRVERPSSDQERGSGLGLSIVYSIAKMHNGSVEIASVVSQGTRVRVLFPGH